MTKRPFKRVQKKKRHGANFWDHEYANPENLSLSSDHSSDLEKFVRFVVRQSKLEYLNLTSHVIDVGCGNGRNLIYLAREFGIAGSGFDISSAAIAKAKIAAGDMPLSFSVQSMAKKIDLENSTQSIALDMMSSHFLNKAERSALRDEIYRVLKPGGYLFMKTFLKDGDKHTERLLQQFPGKEEGGYIHPVIGAEEYVYGETELEEFLGEKFTIERIYKSHRHVSHGKAKKRRTISVYARKAEF